ncbi:MAG: hypothetical protein ACJAVE_000110 [Polaribacter sp.]|jgi:hypothetical protein
MSFQRRMQLLRANNSTTDTVVFFQKQAKIKKNPS